MTINGEFKNIYYGKVDLDKIIFFHEKEAFMGSYTGNAKRAEFHNKVVNLLKGLKAEVK